MLRNGKKGEEEKKKRIRQTAALLFFPLRFCRQSRLTSQARFSLLRLFYLSTLRFANVSLANCLAQTVVDDGNGTTMSSRTPVSSPSQRGKKKVPDSSTTTFADDDDTSTLYSLSLSLSLLALTVSTPLHSVLCTTSAFRPPLFVATPSPPPPPPLPVVAFGAGGARSRSRHCLWVILTPPPPPPPPPRVSRRLSDPPWRQRPQPTQKFLSEE